VSRLGELKACVKQWVLIRQQNVYDDEQVRILEGSEFQTEVETAGGSRERHHPLSGTELY